MKKLSEFHSRFYTEGVSQMNSTKQTLRYIFDRLPKIQPIESFTKLKPT